MEHTALDLLKQLKIVDIKIQYLRHQSLSNEKRDKWIYLFIRIVQRYSYFVDRSLMSILKAQDLVEKIIANDDKAKHESNGFIWPSGINSGIIFKYDIEVSLACLRILLEDKNRDKIIQEFYCKELAEKQINILNFLYKISKNMMDNVNDYLHLNQQFIDLIDANEGIKIKNGQLVPFIHPLSNRGYKNDSFIQEYFDVVCNSLQSIDEIYTILITKNIEIFGLQVEGLFIQEKNTYFVALGDFEKSVANIKIIDTADILKD